MNQSSQARRMPREDERDLWVVSKVPEGYRVYQAGNPAQMYLVTGTANAPSCTCGAARMRCVHVQSVFRNQESPQFASDSDDDEFVEPDSAESGRVDDGRIPSQLVLKRSVSPDGKIDALSIEFALSCDAADADGVVDDAMYAISLQTVIAERFLTNHQRNGNGHQNNGGAQHNGNGHSNGRTIVLGQPIHARLKDIQGMETRQGWSYYLNVEINGQLVRLFGDKRKIQGYIDDTGHGDARNVQIAKGVRLDIPCRVVLSRGDNAKYFSVNEVMPASTSQERYNSVRCRR